MPTEKIKDGPAPTTSVLLKTLYSHDDFGNLVQLTDPKLNVTNFSWTDSWDTSGGGNDSTCMPSPGSFAYVTTITNAKNQPVTAKYRPCTGALSEVFDLNNQQTTYAFDSLGRILSETLPDMPSTPNTTITYDDPNRVVTFQRLRDTGGDQITSSATYDMIGRVTIHSLTAPEGAETVEYFYDGRDRKTSQTNPHLAQSSPTDGTTLYVLDGLSRATTVTEQDTSSVNTDYTQFPSVTVTDEAGKKRKTKVDGAGRLVQVIEDPAGMALESDYQYDAAGNLLCVEQHGGVTGTGCSSNPSNDSTSPWRVRRFTYDDVSRLLTATNPESGAIAYTYDADGNVVTKTDARGITTCFGDWSSSTCNGATGYDVLNRLLKKTYSDGSTPTVQYGYDGVGLKNCTISAPGDIDSHPLGHRTSMCDGSGATNWTHDQMGRILQVRRTIGTVSGKYDIDVYNPDGSPSSVTTLGYKVTYTYDLAGRPITATNYTGGTNKFVSGSTYAPPAELILATLGSTTGFAGFTVTNAYNNRLQPTLLSASSPSATVFSDSFDFHLGAGDNGNVFKIVNNRDTTHARDQNFMYDSLNRIQQAYSTGSGTFSWGETFSPTATGPGIAPTTPGIDAWGNLTNRSGVTGKTYAESLNCPANGKNQLTACSTVYDAAGNMTGYGTASYVYDAESRLIATAGYSYIYDGNGQRVEKCTEGTTPGTCASGATGTLYWRGVSSDPLSETNLGGTVQNNYAFFDGQRVARVDGAGAVHYYFSDHLGTHGVVENAAGAICEQDIDYYPYGGVENDYCSGTGVPQNYKFTGKERDTESGLDYFGARHNASTMGRFMTPDPGPYIWRDPQTLNRYAYTRNNPLKFVDPTGMYLVVAAKDQKFFQKALSDIYRRPGGRELIKTLAGSDKPVLLDRGEQNTATTGTVAISKALAIMGTPGVSGVHTTVGTDADLYAGAKKKPDKVGATKTTAHELEHDKDGLAAGQNSLVAGAAAMANGDAPSSPGAKDTTGGTAQAGADEIMAEKPDMNSKDANAAIQDILQSGQQQWQNSQTRTALCDQNKDACH